MKNEKIRTVKCQNCGDDIDIVRNRVNRAKVAASAWHHYELAIERLDDHKDIMWQTARMFDVTADLLKKDNGRIALVANLMKMARNIRAWLEKEDDDHSTRRNWENEICQSNAMAVLLKGIYDGNKRNKKKN